jgi:hypothetical protein
VNYYLAAFTSTHFRCRSAKPATRQTLTYAGDLIGDGWSILIFPRGTVIDRDIKAFRGGIGMMAAASMYPSFRCGSTE